MFQVIAAIILICVVIQVLYTGSFFIRGRGLIKKEYTGERVLGDSKKPEFKVLVDGDSVGAGVGATLFETSVAGRIAEFYAQDHKVIFKNHSISGSTMRNLVTRVLPEQKQDLVVLIISSNDLFHFRNVGEFRKDTQEVLERYSKISDKLIIIGPGRIFDAQAIPFFIRPIYRTVGLNYTKVLAQESKKFQNVTYIDPFEKELDRKIYGITLAPDGFHPNDSGHAFWFDLIKPHL